LTTPLSVPPAVGQRAGDDELFEIVTVEIFGARVSELPMRSLLAPSTVVRSTPVAPE